MKTKPVPEAPASVAAFSGWIDSLPASSGTRSEWLERLDAAGGPVRHRRAAKEWYAFLRALDLLVRSGADGRLQRDRTRLRVDDLAERFLRGVYQASSVLAVLRSADPPVSPATLLAAGIEPTRWEAYRPGDRHAVWSDRLERILDWFVVLELAEPTADGWRSR